MGDKSTIHDGEYHPAADSAMTYMQAKMADIPGWFKIKESIASTALSGNCLSEICLGTIDRLENSEPVSDRYLLGLAWLIREMEIKSSK